MRRILVRIKNIITGRFFIYMFLITLQVLYFGYVYLRLTYQNMYLNAFLTLLSWIICFWLLMKDDNPNYRMSWILFILIFPTIGGLFYLFAGNKRPSYKIQNSINPVIEKMNTLMPRHDELHEEIADQCLISLEYLSNLSYPIYRNTKSRYYSLGDYAYPDLLSDLKKARHFIFMEYFIISKGLMYDTIFDLLIQKSQSGVDVRLIYDDFGSLFEVPFQFKKRLKQAGIKFVCFNPFRPIFSLSQNHRDHRKLCVIDGYIGYSGGFNIADEYINCKMRYGHWKDTGVRLEGEGVFTLTMMFLTTFHAFHPELKNEDIEAFKPHTYHPEAFASSGYVLPYGDQPLDENHVGEEVYLNLITHAQHEIKIMTPYLIIDDAMVKALTLAAHNGIDVKIFTPHIPDKKLVFRVTRSYYYLLMKAGVKIYEYMPGFLHAKVVMIDGIAATVGTINFDYRSLYLHFENNIILYKTASLEDIKADFVNLEGLSVEVPRVEGKRFTGVFEAFMRLLSPLL